MGEIHRKTPSPRRRRSPRQDDQHERVHRSRHQRRDRRPARQVYNPLQRSWPNRGLDAVSSRGGVTALGGLRDKASSLVYIIAHTTAQDSSNTQARLKYDSSKTQVSDATLAQRTLVQ